MDIVGAPFKAIAGAVVSRTVTVKLAVVSLPAPSVAVHATWVSPLAKIESAAGAQATVAPEKPSDALKA